MAGCFFGVAVHYWRAAKTFPITEEDEANEITEGCDEMRVLNWKAGVKAADQLLCPSSFFDGDNSEFKHQCLLLLDKMAATIWQLLVQNEITNFASVRRPTSSENTAGKSSNIASDAPSLRSSSRDITARIRNAGRIPAVAIDVTNDIE